MINPPERHLADGPGRLTRRTLLGGALAAVAAGAGCTPAARPPAGPTPYTVAALTGTDPFYVAHRGGGGNWPEMTAYAYAQAARVPGMKALEVSVCLSSDGVLVCSHDPTTTRLTGMPYVIAEQTWDTLSQLRVSGKETTDPRQAAQPFTRLDEVVDTYADRFVLFVEPKVGAATEPLMRRMAALGRPEQVVWKQPVNSSAFATAHNRGFTTWGYVLDEEGHVGDNLARFAASPEIDMLGAPQGAPDAFVTAVTTAAAAQGKPTIAWPIRSTADRDRVHALGCAGMMVSRPLQVMAVTGG